MTHMISITIADEHVFSELQKEENKSRLITHLLKEHYKTPEEKRGEMSLEQIRERKKEIKDGAETEEKELQALKELENEILMTQEEKEKQDIINRARRIDSFKGSFLTFFKVTEEQAQKLAEEYEDKKTLGTIFEFGEAKHLTEKEPK